MQFLLKVCLLTFTLMQAVQAGRYYNTENGRFISRDPIANPQDPKVVMLHNSARYHAAVNREFFQRDSSTRYSEQNGYHDGMSLYNAYFAERFTTDPSGLESGMGPHAGRTPRYDLSERIADAREEKKRLVQEALNNKAATKCVYDKQAKTLTCTDPQGNTETCKTVEQNKLKENEKNGPIS